MTYNCHAIWGHVQGCEAVAVSDGITLLAVGVHELTASCAHHCSSAVA